MTSFTFSVPLVIGWLAVFGLLIFLLFAFLRWKSKSKLALFHTGLKVVDLLLPIAYGADVLVSGESRAGARVLGNELAYRLVNQPQHACRVILYLDSAMDEIDVFRQEIQEALPSLQDLYVVSSVTAQELHRHRSSPSAYRRDAIFAVSNDERFVYAFRQAVKTERYDARASASLTTFVVTEWIIPEGFDAKLISSQRLAAEGHYPAIDLRLSSSTAFSLIGFPARRKQVADSLRRAVNDVIANLYPGAMQDPNWPFNRDDEKRAAVQALQYLSQPYFIAEPYTGLQAAYVPVEVTVRNFEQILSGRFTDLPLTSFTFKNELIL